jgi:hypothetical protein
METKQTGWRTVPPALLVALVVPIVYAIARIPLWPTFDSGGGGADDFSTKIARVVLIGEGAGYVAQVFAIIGALELARRATGRARLGFQLAVAGVACAFAVDNHALLNQFTKNPWEHQWVFKAYSYAAIGSWLVFAVGLFLALPEKLRVLGIVGLVVTFVTWLPAPLHDAVFGWMKLGEKSGQYFEAVLRVIRYGTFVALAVGASHGETTTDVYAASSGFRLASRALWLRVIAALAVVMMTLMMIGSRGEGVSMFKLFMLAQGVLSFAALTMFGVGAARVARSAVSGMPSWTLVVGGGASLWAAGVSLAQIPYLYKMLYRDGGESWSRNESMAWAQALSTVLPIVVIVGVALLATAISGYAARRADEDLRSSAQANGIGFIALMLVAIAVQTWMLPKSRSIGNFAMLSLMAAAAGLWATILMAKLLTRASVVVESEPTMPTATVVNVGASPGAGGPIDPST